MLIPEVTLIAAMDRNRVIGYEGKMPWSLPRDLKLFKQRTLGKPIVMGRRTFEAIGARPLPGRRNLVLSRDSAFLADGAEVCRTISEVFLKTAQDEELMVIGGATLYRAFMPLATRLVLTFVDAEFVGDTLFPEFSSREWKEIERVFYAKDERNPYNFDFVTFQRIDATP